jgi:lipopolysaccharide export system protein LptA
MAIVILMCYSIDNLYSFNLNLSVFRGNNMSVSKLFVSSQCLIAVLFLNSVSVNALFVDNKTQNTINIESNSGAIIDFKQKTADYFGKVKITYGKSYLNADKVCVYQNDNDISRIIASSETTPVFLKLIGYDSLSTTIVCQGKKIDCDMINNKLVISGSATLDYDNNYITSDTIYYDHKLGTINAKPNASSDNSNTNKVHITINNPNSMQTKKN